MIRPRAIVGPSLARTRLSRATYAARRMAGRIARLETKEHRRAGYALLGLCVWLGFWTGLQVL
jgi:hypothetical protein